MPYIYAQAKDSSARGFPMLRALFFEFPADETSWLIEDEYMFGANLLVAPLFEDEKTTRKVYLPPGAWIDYQTGKIYEGGRWHEIAAGEIPARIVHETAELIAFHDITPQAPVHVLIVPRRVIPRLAAAAPSDAELLGQQRRNLVVLDELEFDEIGP